MKVFPTDTAKLDLIDIIDYYDSHIPAIADHFEDEFQHKLDAK